VLIYAQHSKKKVVLISIDGTPDYLVDKYLANGVLPKDGAFARMKKFGAYAKTVMPINVASTGPSHISIFTGASPSNTGIVGNSFKSKLKPFSQTVLNAFRQPINVETIFQSAMNQGKKVISMGGVGLDNLSDDRKVDMMHMYPIISGPSWVVDFKEINYATQNRFNVQYRSLRPIGITDSIFSIDISGKLKIPLHFYLSDTTIVEANMLKKTAKISIDNDKTINNGFALQLGLDEWSILGFEHSGKQYNVSFRVISSNKNQCVFRILMTTPVEVFSNPPSFLKKIQSTIGFWPGEPENIKQTQGLVPESIWFEQLDRLAKYSKNLILEAMKEENWDLIFGYFSTLDDIQHRYTVSNPRQLDYNADNGMRPKIYSSYIEQRFNDIDAYLLEIMNAAPKETNFVIFSDHGMIPIHTTLLLNNYFEQLGSFITKNILSITSSGNSAHIYINKDSFNVTSFSKYINWLIVQLNKLTDPVTREPIFEIVANEEIQKKYGLYHPDYSGHLFVSCKEGYSISAKFQPAVGVFVKNTFDPVLFEKENENTKAFLVNGTMNETGRAVHGSLSSIRSGQSIFYAIGPNIPKKKLGIISSLKIAPTVASILGIKPPRSAEAAPLF
jgi:predicted AlkP superfamily pyrophosphatase or phosphodiesterase